MAMMMIGVSHQIKNQNEIHQTHLRAKVRKVLHLRKMKKKEWWFFRKGGWPLTLNSCECSDFMLSQTDSREMVIFQVKMYYKQLLTLIYSNMWPQPSTHQFPSCNSWFLCSSLLKEWKLAQLYECDHCFIVMKPLRQEDVSRCNHLLCMMSKCIQLSANVSIKT